MTAALFGSGVVAVAVLAGTGAWALARHWNRRRHLPFPFAVRWLLSVPRPYHTPRRLCHLLDPQPGERILEIGPGMGTHALPVAAVLGPTGRLHVVDVQPAMLNELGQRAKAAHVPSISGCAADAISLPYGRAAFDAAYLITVLGELSDQETALRELHRVLKPGARLIIGEICVDPDFVPLTRLRERGTRAQFAYRRKSGNRLAYLARFESLG